MNQIYLSNSITKGVSLGTAEGQPQLLSLFGLAGGHNPAVPECSSLLFVDSDAGRFEGKKWELVSVNQVENGVDLIQRAGGVFEARTEVRLHAQTGVISWNLSLSNLDGQDHVIYSCLPRFILQGGAFEAYAQYSTWCGENQGSWVDLKAGNLVLTNSAGRSCDSATPFACIRNKFNGMAIAFHVLPMGDWVIRMRRLSGHRNSFTLVEAGLSDASLRMVLPAGETVEMPELLMVGFEGDVINCSIPIQKYILDRFPNRMVSPLVYNTWFLDYDTVEMDRMMAQARRAAEIGCKYFVVDAGWFGQGEDWENQVGCWDECTVRAFGGKLRDFADYVRSLGLGFGIWMEPERACPGTWVYDNHPEWFLKSDSILYDLRKQEVRDYLADKLTEVVNRYDCAWMKMDYNTDMARDLLGDNFYSYYQGEKLFMEEIRRRNPGCTFEGCAGGGMRTDISNVMKVYHGHFVSDTVNPFEVLRMRQGAALRLNPAYLGSWLVLEEVSFPISTYTNRDRFNRTKVYSCGDAWWEHTLDVDLDFALYANQMGEYGLSGDICSLSEKTVEKMKKAAAFYDSHRAFMSRTVCHLLTKPEPLDYINGWTAMQYENVDGEGSILYAFRFVDDAETLYLYPKNLEQDRAYRLLQGGEEVGIFTGAALMQNGIAANCPERYRARMFEILPV